MTQPSKSETAASTSAGAGDGRVVLLSMRNISKLVGYCAAYEFEDVVADVTGADVVAPADLAALEFSRRVYKAARLVTRSPRLAGALKPHVAVRELTSGHELFLAAGEVEVKRAARRAALLENVAQGGPVETAVLQQPGRRLEHARARVFCHALV